VLARTKTAKEVHHDLDLHPRDNSMKPDKIKYMARLAPVPLMPKPKRGYLGHLLLRKWQFQARSIQASNLELRVTRSILS